MVFIAQASHGIIETMFKRYTASIGIIFTVVMLGVVHIYSPVARGLSAHTASHSQHASDSTCQIACQATVDKQKNRPSSVKDQDDNPSPRPPYFNTVAIEAMGVGLLKAGTVWRQSSWVPPDITLLSGHYSSSL
jgi:hypothetical protein